MHPQVIHRFTNPSLINDHPRSVTISAAINAAGVVVKEPLIVVMPSDHRLTSQAQIALQDIADEAFIGMSNTAPALRAVIEEYPELMGVDLKPAQTLGADGIFPLRTGSSLVAAKFPV
jgi:hypothetical protein